ncbi:MAG: hypothetical protein U0401_05400 [Anaerolineae bacterium]
MTTTRPAATRLTNFMRDAQKMIYHYEGSVNKLAVGDKGNVLLVLFGAPPFFHEDDEVRAIACATALVKWYSRRSWKQVSGWLQGRSLPGRWARRSAGNTRSSVIRST